MPRIREERDEAIVEKTKEKEKKKEKEQEKEREKQTGLLFQLPQVITFLVVFAAGLVIGLTTSSHINKNLILQADQYTTLKRASHFMPLQLQQQQQRQQQPLCSLTQPPQPQPPYSSPVSEEGDQDHYCFDMNSFLHPPNLNHSMSDEELFWRASLVPKRQGYPYMGTPKVAFMFLTRGPLPMIPLWERFFQGHDHFFNIYVHSPPGYDLNVSNSSAFYGRQIPSQKVSWGSVSLSDAERRLLANALLDFSNERFVLLSESCIPVYNFPTVYRYLTESKHSFVESYDDPSRYGRGRYSRKMRPDIELKDWRKGSQWFELNRTLAIYIVSESHYYHLFSKYCKPSCYPDEHYLPTYLNMFHGSHNSNRTVTWVNWSFGGPHPATYSRANITVDFLQSIRNNGTVCSYNSYTTHVCYLFARKFDSTALEPLLELSSQVMNF